MTTDRWNLPDPLYPPRYREAYQEGYLTAIADIKRLKFERRMSWERAVARASIHGDNALELWRTIHAHRSRPVPLLETD